METKVVNLTVYISAVNCDANIVLLKYIKLEVLLSQGKCCLRTKCNKTLTTGTPLYRYVRRTNVLFLDPNPDLYEIGDQIKERYIRGRNIIGITMFLWWPCRIDQPNKLHLF